MGKVGVVIIDNKLAIAIIIAIASRLLFLDRNANKPILIEQTLQTVILVTDSLTTFALDLQLLNELLIIPTQLLYLLLVFLLNLLLILIKVLLIIRR